MIRYERLPSGHFASNSLVLHGDVKLQYLADHRSVQLGGGTGQGDQFAGSPSSKYVQRRRIRTVIQDLIYMAGRLVYRGRQWYIGFGRLNPFAQLWGLIDCRLRGANAQGFCSGA